MSLSDDLTNLREKVKNQVPPDQHAIMTHATQDLAGSGIIESAHQEGDLAPEFVLPNAFGTPVSLSEHLKKGPVVLSFYRGGW